MPCVLIQWSRGGQVLSNVSSCVRHPVPRWGGQGWWGLEGSSPLYPYSRERGISSSKEKWGAGWGLRVSAFHVWGLCCVSAGYLVLKHIIEIGCEEFEFFCSKWVLCWSSAGPQRRPERQRRYLFQLRPAQGEFSDSAQSRGHMASSHGGKLRSSCVLLSCLIPPPASSGQAWRKAGPAFLQAWPQPRGASRPPCIRGPRLE